MTAQFGPASAPIRVVAVTQSDPFFTGHFFERFLAVAAPKVQVVEIVLLRNFNESRLALLRRLGGFYGPLGLARLVIRYARAMLDERRGRSHSVEAVAAQNGVPTRTLPTINDGGYLESLRAREVDVLLSVAAPEIFGPEALRAAPTVLNVHNGRLPDYRGMMPTFWALLEGAPEVTVTVHEMADRLDAGAIIAEFPVAVGAGDSAFAVSRKAKAVAGQEVAALLGTLATGPLPPGRKVDIAEGRYHGFPRRSDARRLIASGRALL